MIFDRVYAHRLEGPRADVQRHKRHLDAFLTQFFQQRFIKVQTGGRCRDSAWFFAVDRLIQLAVSIFIRAVDIRRQRHVADSIQNIQHRAFIIKLDFKQRAVAGRHRRVDAFIIAQQQFRTRLWRFGGANMCQNTFVIEHTLNQHFNLAAAGFTPKQTRRDHAGIVKDQQIARVELVEQIGESTVRQRARWPVQ
ncbi:hypothetical protein D3C76_935890 [compost metagenome]